MAEQKCRLCGHAQGTASKRPKDFRAGEQAAALYRALQGGVGGGVCVPGDQLRGLGG